MKIAKEYCWTITQVTGWSCYGRSGAAVLELGFQLGSIVYAYTRVCFTVLVLKSDLHKIQLLPGLPERQSGTVFTL
jgi:hypothetical protein